MTIDIFKLATMQLEKEGKDLDSNMETLVERATQIRAWINKHGLKSAERIMMGVSK